MADKKIEVKKSGKTPRNLERSISTNTWWIGIFVVIFVFAAVMFTTSGEKKKETTPPSIDVGSGDMDELAWQARAQADIQAAEEKAAAARKTAEQLQEAFKYQRQIIRELTNSVDSLEQTLATRGPVVQTLPAPEPPEPPASDKGYTTPPLPDQDDFASYDAGGGEGPVLPPPPPVAPGADDSRGPVQANRYIKERGSTNMMADAPNGQGAIIFNAPELEQASAGGPGGSEADYTYKENPFAGFLPAGSFAKIVLLTGVDAGASQQTQANPQPVLMRVQMNARTPGGGRYALKDCFLIGSAYGDLSSERAYIRIARLSCIDRQRGLVIETQINGYITDSDGFMGLRGKVVRRNGQMLAKAILAGFADGLATVAEAASSAAAQTVTAPFSAAAGLTNQTDVSIDAGGLAKAGAFGGAANAAEMIADYYLKAAQSIFPVISIPPGRKGTAVITEGASLEWKSYKGQYIKKVIPKDK